MKNALVVVRPQSRYIKNIGDYIQSIATAQFLDSIDYYIDRNELHDFQETAKAIINGCFIWDTKKWPPSDNIDPLFVSMHIFPSAENGLLCEENKQYWINHSPIGCRDKNTLRMFQERNIPSYFSACLTLTLGKKYKHEGERNGIYFVDPFIPVKELVVRKHSIPIPMFSEWIKLFKFAIRHPRILKRLYAKPFFGEYGAKFGHSRRKGISKVLNALYNISVFYKTYSSRFTNDIIFNAEYITHMFRFKQNNITTDTEFCEVAKHLIEKYAKAKLVITSRIHAALPCLGLDTPVIFMIHEDMEADAIKFNTPGRYDGIIDLMRCLRITKKGIVAEDIELNKLGQLSPNSTFSNKQEWKKYADALEKTVTEFMNAPKNT